MVPKVSPVLLLQNTVPCQLFGTMTFRLAVSAPVVVRHEQRALLELAGTVRSTSAVVMATLPFPGR